MSDLPSSSMPTGTNTLRSPLAYWMMQPNVHFLELAKDRLTVKYIGRANHPHDVGTIRADRPLYTNKWLGYYEIKILDVGNKISISIGLASQEFPLNRMPGMDTDSLGYSGEEGKKYQSGNKGEAYGPSFSVGDIIGCGYDYRNQEVFFTLNGRYLGIAFHDITHVLYPVVGLHSSGEAIIANFGQHEFKYDLQGYIQDQYDKIRLNVSQISLDVSLINEIIKGYVLHSGYEDTSIELLKYLKVNDSDEPLLKTLKHRKGKYI
jgi:hypothetical protein